MRVGARTFGMSIDLHVKSVGMQFVLTGFLSL